MTNNIPNLLTLFRVALIPVFIYVFYLPTWWAHYAVTFIFWLASMTDLLDGYLARKLNQSSAFGAFLDPIADKLIVAVALILLVDQNPTDYAGVWISLAAIIIISRELLISGLREWMAKIGGSEQTKVSFIGKLKTTVQMFAILFLLYKEPFLGIPSADFGFWLLYIAVLLTLVSMFDYLFMARKKLYSSE